MQDDFRKLISLAQEAGIQPLYQTGNIACAFVGEWNAGKTSIINALIEVHLPVKSVPTTKTVVLIRNAKSPEIMVKHENGRVEKGFGDEAYLLAEKCSSTDVLKIEYGAPEISIPEQVVLIDTPGFNDQDAVANTKAESTNADVIVFVLQGAGTVLGEKQQEFIEQTIIAKGNALGDIFFLITHSDMISDEIDRNEILERFLEIGHGKLESSQFHFVSLQAEKEDGVEQFKDCLYEHLEECKATVLPDRIKRLTRQLKSELKHALARQKELLRYQQEEKEGKKSELKKQLVEARSSERNKREQIRLRYRQKMDDFENKMALALEGIQDELEILIDGLSEQELKAKGRIRNEISDRISTKVEPLIETMSEQFQTDLEQDLKDAEALSCDLANGLNLDLPKYIPRGPKISAEAILPVAAIGTLLTAGVFSIPFFAVGIATLYADKLGLTGRGGYLNLAAAKVKSLGLAAHKRAVKSSIAGSLGDYRWKVKNDLSDVLEKVIEQQLQKIGYVEKIEQDLQKVLSDTGTEKTRVWIDKVEDILNKQRTFKWLSSQIRRRNDELFYEKG